MDGGCTDKIFAAFTAQTPIKHDKKWHERQLMDEKLIILKVINKTTTTNHQTPSIMINKAEEEFR